MGIEPTHRLLGGAQDLKSWEGTSPQPLPKEPDKKLAHKNRNWIGCVKFKQRTH